MGHLIPGGTGFPLHHKIRLVQKAEPIAEADMIDIQEAERKFDQLWDK